MSDDGKEFETVKDCQKYEEELKEKERISAQFKFFNSIGIMDTEESSDFNQRCNYSHLVFNKKGEVYGIKTIGDGCLERNGIIFDFKYGSSDEKKNMDVMCNWLRQNQLYAHSLSSFRGRHKEWYEMPLLKKLENLAWDVKDGELINLSW